MKTVILCGGRGTRLGEHGQSVPKALVEIGGRPLLWHLLKLYATHGLNDFVLCLGHLGAEIKRYFLEHHWLHADFTLEMGRAGDYQLRRHGAGGEDWRITFAETGPETSTGGRLKRAARYLEGEEVFCVTYGDGLADVDLGALIRFHDAHGRVGTLTAVRPRTSFGVLRLDGAGAVTEFQEKPVMGEWINGGFFVFRRGILDYLGEDSVLEREPLERLAAERQLMAYRHEGFWKCLDTYKDHVEFNRMWEAGEAPWRGRG